MGDTGLETVGGGQVRRDAPCSLSFDVLKLAEVRSGWNLEWNLGHIAEMIWRLPRRRPMKPSLV